MRTRALGCALLLTLSLLVGCTTGPDPIPTSTASPREYLTIATTDPLRQIDPAGVVDQGSAGIVGNVFQRLMTAPPGESVAKPDAARDCKVDNPTVVVCTLNADMTFQNGHALTSSDVKFSIQRALRLDIGGSSVSLLSTLRRIETPDDLTVRFVLNRPDTEFVFALASPAASIVDEEVYDPDKLRDPALTVVGSGPYRISQQDTTTLRFDRFAKYVGPHPAATQTLLVRIFPDSPSVEDAMQNQSVDAVWRGLSNAAVARLDDQLQTGAGRTPTGFSEQVNAKARVHLLAWRPDSPRRGDAALRTAISAALQPDRVLDSIIPPTVDGNVAAFPVGGSPDSVPRPGRTTLTLSYDSTSPDAADTASVLRTRIEAQGDLSVRVVADAADADLHLLDEKAWTDTPLSWLQRYLDAPAIGSSTRVAELTDRYQATNIYDDAERDGLLSELQKQAAADAVLLPLDQTDEHLYLAQGVRWDAASFGPAWQLGLWGVSKA